jgi:hypothetical protein
MLEPLLPPGSLVQGGSASGPFLSDDDDIVLQADIEYALHLARAEYATQKEEAGQVQEEQDEEGGRDRKQRRLAAPREEAEDVEVVEVVDVAKGFHHHPW